MDILEVSTQYRVRQCFQCEGDPEFYCNTCKLDLCLLCKEKHVIDLDTKHHDVVIYREKYEYITKQETCERHKGKIYEMFCKTCDLPACFQCEEHRKHNIFDIRTAYKTNRQIHRKIIHNIRSETLYNRCCVLIGIRSDIKSYHPDLLNNQPKMLIKAQKLRYLIDTVICDVKIRHKIFIQSLQKQRRKINRHLANIETFEHRSNHLADRPIEFVIFQKRTRVHKLKDTPNLTHYALVCVMEEINKGDATDLLAEIQIIETGKRQVRMENLLKLVSTPVSHRSVTVTGAICHISCVTPDGAWISDGKNLILINSEGYIPHHLTDVITVGGQHTVNLIGDLIYIDRNGNIIKFSKDNRSNSTLIKKTEQWVPQCVYSSHLNGDLLVGMRSYKTGILARYNDTGYHLHNIQQDNTGHELYSDPVYITENRNGDVIVSNIYGRNGAVVVTDSTGRHRFSYTGHPSGSRFFPLGICTDALSHILVCDSNTDTIEMLDKNGHFLSLLLTRRQKINRPMALSCDNKTHLFWVGISYSEQKIRLYRCIERHDFLQY